ncbi:MAG TPA: bifunctional acetate--CoA ligase family protein/GNAT family N-acetyltransferase [Candidatus Limnocylindrales bacterium]|nr:bifunctional acetate--CoA ligase family protein/GNAT family N-acetyltransferase [Candidatus Limnocylindrales bacterium]
MSVLTPTLAPDPSSDILHVDRHPLDAFFQPRSVAVIGATEKPGSVGRTILWNLLSSPFGGTVYPVNPSRGAVLGVRAYASIGAIGEPVDLAVVVTPAGTAPGIVEECGRAGVRGVIIISAGFKEVGAEGVELERRVLEAARAHGIRVIGPNCLGVMNPVGSFNATFAAAIAKPGRVGFVSQSGALLTAILDWAALEDVGFSSIVSLGSMLDVGWGDVIDYLGDDPNTDSIVIYMETIGDARAFLSAAREVALTKPIIVIKPGRTAQAAKAAASHTGSLTGSDDVLDAAFRRAGVLRVDSISELFEVSEILAKQPRPGGRRLSIVTNAGGPGVIATDALIGGGGVLTELTPETMERLNAVLPAVWSHNNPIDIIGDAPPERYAQALEVAAADPGADGLLVILTPQAMTDPTATARALARHARIPGKPVLASWMGGAEVAEGAAILREAGIPTFAYPDTACVLFNHLWRYQDNLRLLYETPSLPVAPERGEFREEVDRIVEAVAAEGRTLLTEYESKKVLAAYGIPITDTELAATPDEAVAAADDMGYPVVAKLLSRTITHKTDVGGVRLNLRDAAAVRDAFDLIREAVEEKAGPGHFEGVTIQPMVDWSGYELIVGSSPDPQFGPVLLFGMGGQLVEVFRDRALALPPLNMTLARRLIEQTTIARALPGVRGRRPIDVDVLAGLLVRFSELVAEQPRIAEIDINPVLASPERIIALDARVVLHPAEVADRNLPRLAIRPYPHRYVREFRDERGTPVVVRPIRPEDEPALARFHGTLSPATVRARYGTDLALAERTAHERLTRICFVDYDREIALVAEVPDADGPAVAGVARLSKIHATDRHQVSLVVADAWQGRGIGRELLRSAIGVARGEDAEGVVAELSPENRPMRSLLAEAGFSFEERGDMLIASLATA